MGFRRLEAKVVLAWLFFTHLFKRIVFFWNRPKGLPKFLSLFQTDAIFPISSHERAMFPEYERCQACSLCTLSCEPIRKGKAPSGFEPKMILLGFGRSSHEAEIFLEEWVPCLECGDCTVLCPNSVPVHEMAKQIQERRGFLAFRR